MLIFDEVVTGFRVSKGGAQSYFGITPDMTTLAKILGGGLPGGAVTGKADIINMIEDHPGDAEYNRYRRIAHNGTFNANPLSAAAGIKCLELVANTPVNDTADARALQLKNGLNDLLSKMEIPGCATGISSLMFLRLGVGPRVRQRVLHPDAGACRAGGQRRSQSAAKPGAAKPRRPFGQPIHPDRVAHGRGHRLHRGRLREGANGGP